MRPRIVPTLTLALSLPLALAACTTPGLRADGGGCPAGEVCSDETPDGLFFGGNQLHDEWLFADPGVKTVARGGREHIIVYEGVDGFFGPTEGAPFTRRFAATSDDGSSMAVDSVFPPDVVVTGVDDGFAYLRISEPTTHELFDMVQVGVASVDRMALLPSPTELVFSDGDPSQHPWAMHTGGERVLDAALYGAYGERLVDDGLALSVRDGSAELREQPYWDVASVDRETAGEVTVTAALSDGTEFTARARFVAAIDEIRLGDDESNTLSQPLTNGQSALICFEALAGGVTVFGTPWAFSASASLDAEPAAFFYNCVGITPTEVGSATVTAHADGIELTVDLEVVDPPPATARARGDLGGTLLTPERGSALPGERAALIGAETIDAQM